MSQHEGLVRFCLKERFKWINEVAYWFGLVDILDEIQYKKSMEVSDYLKRRKKLEEDKIKTACAELLLIETVVRPVEVEGYRSKSVLLDACIISKKLKELVEGNDGSMGRVDVLCYNSLQRKYSCPIIKQRWSTC